MTYFPTLNIRKLDDIEGFHIGLQYETPGDIRIYGSSDAYDWKEIPYTQADVYEEQGKTTCRLHNRSALPADTNYLRISMNCANKNGALATSAVTWVNIEGDHSIVREFQRICEKQGVAFRDVFSVTHAAGKYSLRDDVDYVNEGVEAVADMGGKMVNLWFSMITYRTDYMYNTDWLKNDPKGSLAGLAQTEYFQKAFSNPDIERFTLFVDSADRYPMDLPAETSDYDRQSLLQVEYDDVYALADHLLKTYDGMGKTFIIQTWESDAWLMVDGKMADYRLRNYRDYINNRQKAVEDARKANPDSDVKLYNCMELSWVEQAESLSLLETVIPQTNCDLYAYSCWETCIVGGRGNYADALDKFADRVHPTEALGERNFYIGEYGIPETEYGAEQFFAYNTNNCKAIINAGYRYANYWQLFCNEGESSNDISKHRGFWLIRADGTKTGLYNLFKMLLTH